MAHVGGKDGGLWGLPATFQWFLAGWWPRVMSTPVGGGYGGGGWLEKLPSSEL